MGARISEQAQTVNKLLSDLYTTGLCTDARALHVGKPSR